MQNVGNFVAETQGTGTPRTAQGGTLTPGTYVLTQHAVYQGSVDWNYERKHTFKFAAGGAFDYVGQKRDTQPDPDLVDPEERWAGTWSASGSSLTMVVTCPIGRTNVINYSAEGDKLYVIDRTENGGTKEVFTYTRQQ
jgi:hypothetical protein